MCVSGCFITPLDLALPSLTFFHLCILCVRPSPFPFQSLYHSSPLANSLVLSLSVCVCVPWVRHYNCAGDVAFLLCSLLLAALGLLSYVSSSRCCQSPSLFSSPPVVELLSLFSPLPCQRSSDLFCTHVPISPRQKRRARAPTVAAQRRRHLRRR